mgnify:CR=1 FL=1
MTEPNKKLYRSATNHMLGGVCAGLGDYMGIDPTVVRVVVALATFVSAGTAALVYLAMWLIIPLEPTDTTPQA